MIILKKQKVRELRDPKRIPKILKRLNKVWMENPDLRLGQIISNGITYLNPKLDVFYIEDEELIESIEKLNDKCKETFKELCCDGEGAK